MPGAGCWSFQGAKPVIAGEGGAITTDDTEVFERACLLGQLSRMGALTSERNAPFQPWGLGMKLRAHPLGIGIAGVQMDRLSDLNHGRRAFIEAVEAGLSGIPGLRPVSSYPGAERGGFHGFPLLHVPEENGGVDTAVLIAAITAAGVPAGPSGYPLLHRLPLFARGYDVFTRDRGPLGAGYPGYREGDFPRTEDMHRRLIFLPVLSDPAPEAAEIVLECLWQSVRQISSRGLKKRTGQRNTQSPFAADSRTRIGADATGRHGSAP